LFEVTETPIRPLEENRNVNCEEKENVTCGVCGLDDAEMQLQGEGDEAIVMGEAAVRISKDDGVRVIRKLVDPLKPTKEEVDEHDLFHTPYRNWCPICVKAKGKALDHQKKAELNPSGYSEYSFD